MSFAISIYWRGPDLHKAPGIYVYVWGRFRVKTPLGNTRSDLPDDVTFQEVLQVPTIMLYL